MRAMRIGFCIGIVVCVGFAVMNFVLFAIGGALISFLAGVWCLLMAGVVAYYLSKLP